MKKDNQWTGKLFEYLVCQRHNGETYQNIYPSYISKEMFNSIEKDALLAAQSLKIFSNPFIWTGNETKNKNGDILSGDKIIELKYVSQGKGTYLNTSMENITHYGFTSYRSYLKQFGIYEELEKRFGDKVYKNISPLSRQEALEYYHTQPQEVKKLQQKESSTRTIYITDLYNFFLINPLLLNRFIADCISKNICDKVNPDYLIVFNYNKKTTEIYNGANLFLNSKPNFTHTSKGLKFNNLHIAFGWQNCTPLNNPTIRVFCK